jgi:hypothetical protein
LALILLFGITLAVFRDTLPPKKLLGSKDPGFIMKRRRELESYLQNVFHFLSQDLPPVLADFLDFPKARPSSVGLRKDDDYLLPIIDAIGAQWCTFTNLRAHEAEDKIKIKLSNLNSFFMSFTPCLRSN